MFTTDPSSPRTLKRTAQKEDWPLAKKLDQMCEVASTIKARTLEIKFMGKNGVNVRMLNGSPFALRTEVK